MMKRILFTVIAAFLATFFPPFARTCYAQQTSLSVIQISNLPDTVYAGISYDSITVVVRNMSNNATFHDTIYIYIKQDDSLFFSTATLIFDPNDSILPGSVKTLSTSGFFFSPNVFKPGGNTVVVWPVAKSATTFDSLFTSFFFDTSTAGIPGRYDPVEMIRLWPNPVHEYFYVTNGIGLKQVRIFSITGSLVYDRPYADRKINIERLAPGTYMVEFGFKNGRKANRKMLKW